MPDRSMGNNPLLPVAVIGAVLLGALLWWPAEPPAFDDSPPLVAAPRAASPGVVRGGRHTLTIALDGAGRFIAAGHANNAPFRFQFDTGAGDIVFGVAAVRRLGLDPARLRFDGTASTANGTVRTASARLASLQVGPFMLRDVPVSIDDGELSEPLLGMTFLRRFNITVRGGALTLSD